MRLTVGDRSERMSRNPSLVSARRAKDLFDSETKKSGQARQLRMQPHHV
jgi:hypothetical protein